MTSFTHTILFISARSNCTYTCPSDCVVTKYDLTHSGVSRSNHDLKLYITSLSKKNNKMDELDRKIKSFDDLCISHDEKRQRIKEIEQLRQNIIYSTSHLHFFWQHDTLVSHVRDQVYDLWAAIDNITDKICLTFIVRITISFIYSTRIIVCTKLFISNS